MVYGVDVSTPHRASSGMHDTGVYRRLGEASELMHDGCHSPRLCWNTCDGGWILVLH